MVFYSQEAEALCSLDVICFFVLFCYAPTKTITTTATITTMVISFATPFHSLFPKQFLSSSWSSSFDYYYYHYYYHYYCKFAVVLSIIVFFFFVFLAFTSSPFIDTKQTDIQIYINRHKKKKTDIRSIVFSFTGLTKMSRMFFNFNRRLRIDNY